MKGKPGAEAAARNSGLVWWQWMLPLVGLTFLIYLNSLSNDFVFDDVPLIKDSQEIRSWHNLPQIFGRTGYRPVRTLTYALDYWLFGPDPYYFHLTNVLMHAVNAVLVFLFLRSVFENARSALVGALLFVCHPVQTAAVTYISGRKDLLATGFLLGGMLCFADYRKTQKRSAFLGCIALFILALFSKEIAVVFPALLFAWDFLDHHWEPGAFEGKSLWARTKLVFLEHRRLYGPMIVCAAFFLYYAQFIMYASRKVGFWGGSALNNYLTSLKLFSHYLQLAIVPYPLVADYRGIFPVAAGMSDWTIWVGTIFLAGYFYLLYRSLRRRPRVAFGLFWFLVALLPVIQLLPFHEIAANHYLYLPLVGFIIAVLELVMWRLPALRAPALAFITVALLLAFSTVTVARNRDWRNTLSLWEATIQHAPGSARVQNNLGSALHAAGRLDDALPHLQRATELDPSEAAYWSNLGALYHDLGKANNDPNNYQAAIEALERSVRIEPKNPYSHTNLGNAYKKLALSRNDKDPHSPLWSKAFEHLKTAVALNGAEGALYYNLGLAYYELGQREEAWRNFDLARRVEPRFAQAYLGLGLMANEDGNLQRALDELTQCVILDASNLEAIRLLADIYVVKQNDYQGAKMLLEFAVNKFPANSDLRRRLGLVYLRLGKSTQAREELNLALQLDPKGQKADEILQLLNSLNR